MRLAQSCASCLMCVTDPRPMTQPPVARAALANPHPTPDPLHGHGKPAVEPPPACSTQREAGSPAPATPAACKESGRQPGTQEGMSDTRQQCSCAPRAGSCGALNCSSPPGPTYPNLRQARRLTTPWHGIHELRATLMSF